MVRSDASFSVSHHPFPDPPPKLLRWVVPRELGLVPALLVEPVQVDGLRLRDQPVGRRPDERASRLGRKFRLLRQNLFVDDRRAFRPDKFRSIEVDFVDLGSGKVDVRDLFLEGRRRGRRPFRAEIRSFFVRSWPFLVDVDLYFDLVVLGRLPRTWWRRRRWRRRRCRRSRRRWSLLLVVANALFRTEMWFMQRSLDQQVFSTFQTKNLILAF